MFLAWLGRSPRLLVRILNDCFQCFRIIFSVTVGNSENLQVLSFDNVYFLFNLSFNIFQVAEQQRKVEVID